MHSSRIKSDFDPLKYFPPFFGLETLGYSFTHQRLGSENLLNGVKGPGAEQADHRTEIWCEKKGTCLQFRC